MHNSLLVVFHGCAHQQSQVPLVALVPCSHVDIQATLIANIKATTMINTADGITTQTKLNQLVTCLHL